MKTKFKFHERVKHSLFGLGHAISNSGDMVVCQFKHGVQIVYSKNLIRKVSK